MAETETERVGLSEAIRRGLRKCRVEDGSPVALIRDCDLFHITHMVATELSDWLATREREAEQRGAEKGWGEGSLAMLKAKGVRGALLPPNPYRADATRSR